MSTQPDECANSHCSVVVACKFIRPSRGTCLRLRADREGLRWTCSTYRRDSPSALFLTQDEDTHSSRWIFTGPFRVNIRDHNIRSQESQLLNRRRDPTRMRVSGSCSLDCGQDARNTRSIAELGILHVRRVSVFIRRNAIADIVAH